MRTGRTGKLAAVVLCGLMLSGCEMLEEKFSSEQAPTETTLKVEKDGTVTETVIDKLDQSYYNSGDLEAMINSSVSEYNQLHGADSVKVEEILWEGNQISLKMVYQSAADYGEYNNVKFYNGSMLGAEMEGYLFYNQFKKVEEGQAAGAAISNEEPLKHKEQQVLVTNSDHVVEVPGEVLYVSANGSPTGKKSVKRDAQTEWAKEEGLVLPSSAVYVEEKEDTALTQTDLEKTYLYIIYEF